MVWTSILVGARRDRAMLEEAPMLYRNGQALLIRDDLCCWPTPNTKPVVFLEKAAFPAVLTLSASALAPGSWQSHRFGTYMPEGIRMQAAAE